MNKTQLAAALAAENGNLSAAQALTVLDDLTEIITRQTALDDKVTIPGFGTFGSREVAAPARRSTPRRPASRRSGRARACWRPSRARCPSPPPERETVPAAPARQAPPGLAQSLVADL
jgi:nucleoid DNA-binding protein